MRSRGCSGCAKRVRCGAMKRLLLVCLMLGCGGDDGSTDTQTEQLNNACPAMPSVLKGTKGTGQACVSATECLPSCCSCSTGTNRFLAAGCIDGKCVEGCSVAEPTPSICPP